ncbi:MAG: PASTA domain-containing protein [Chitinophagales bacterium]|nr:PASTA domain-containing protein [Bacteroidota bacterium]
MKEWFSFVFSKQFVKHILIMLAIFILLILATFYWMRIYTNHGEYITLNNLNELSLSQAVDVLEEKGLHYKIIDSSSFNPQFLPEAILQQDPAANSKVKKGRTIYLWINAKTPPFKAIPCLMGQGTLEEAFERLPQIGFKVGEITYVPMEENNEGNPILSLSIAGEKIECGAKAQYGTVIDLEVGEKAGANMVKVPILLGKTLREAEFLMNNELNFGTILYDKQGLIDSSSAVIYKQLPSYKNEPIRIGSTIDVWLTQDLPEDVAQELEALKNDTTSNN